MVFRAYLCGNTIHDIPRGVMEGYGGGYHCLVTVAIYIAIDCVYKIPSTEYNILHR